MLKIKFLTKLNKLKQIIYFSLIIIRHLLIIKIKTQINKHKLYQTIIYLVKICNKKINKIKIRQL
jgi:hypothetical protein